MEQLLAGLPTFLLVSSRIAGMTTTSPVFSTRLMMTPVRVALTLLLGLLIFPTVQPQPQTVEGARLLLSAVQELIVGLVMGFLGQLIFAALQMAGSLLDMDFGLSMAQVLDPVSYQSQPLLGAFFQTLALVVYFTLNAHHWLLRGLAESYSILPVGTLGTEPDGFLHVVALFGSMLAAALKMVLPFLAAMMIATAVLAAVNRAVQQMQVFQLGLGVKAALGLTMLMLVLPFFLSFLESLFSGGHTQLIRTLELLSQTRGE